MDTKVEGKPVNHSTQERMFHKALGEMGVEIEGFLFRSPHDWMPDQYGYKLTFEGGKTVVGWVNWDLDTFSRLLGIVKGGPL